MASRARALGVFIIGGNGFLGSHLARSLRKRARVTVTYVNHPVPLEGVLSLPIDVQNVPMLRKVLESHKPDIVIYLGGPEDHTWVEANAKIADKVFASGASNALLIAETISARFLYISNGSVFDGTRGNYLETDHLSPVTLLGKLKAAGETAVRARSNRASVLRLSPLVGMSHPWRPSLFDQLRRALESNTTIELRDYEYQSWSTVSSAVTAIEAIIDQAPKNPLFHYGGLTRLTAFDLGMRFAKLLGYDENVAREVFVPKKRNVKKGMVMLAEGEKFDFSLNSSSIIRTLGVPVYPIEEVLAQEFQLHSPR